MNRPYDLVILGAGTTALAGALKAAAYGARVLLVEQSQPGGTCINWGCIPSKTLIDKAESYSAAKTKTIFGLDLSVGTPDLPRLAAARQGAVEILRREKFQKLLEAHSGIDILQGQGSFRSNRELRIGDRVVRSERFLIACGGYPRVLPLPGLEQVPCLTSFSALHLQQLPESLLIIGGGVIALEMGQMFSRFGTRVTIIERGERLLKDFDPRLTEIFRRLAEQAGMSFILNAESRRVFRDGGQICLDLDLDQTRTMVRGHQLMFAVGTAPATNGIGLEAAGVRTDDAGYIVTNRQMKTTAAGIWAAGDVAGPPLTAPAGVLEAEVAVANMFDPQARCQADHRASPLAVFTDPEFARVGISGEEALALGRHPIETFLPLSEVAKAHVTGRSEGGFLLWADHPTGTILGVEVLAPRAADVIQEAVLAVNLGLTVSDLARTLHVYPTISEGLRLAAQCNLAASRRTCP